MDSSDIPAPHQPVQPPPALIQFPADSVAFHAHPALGDATLLELRNSVASSAIALTTDGLRQIIEQCQLRLAQIAAAANGAALVTPEKGLYGPDGGRFS